MWKKIMVVAGGVVVALALPFVALALTTDEFPEMLTTTANASESLESSVATAPVQPTGPYVAPREVTDPMMVQEQPQTMVRQQLRVHAETGPPEGFDPIQQRLHADDPLGMGGPSDTSGQFGQGTGGQGRVGGNPDAPMMGAGTGECSHDPVDCPSGGDQEGSRHQGKGAGNSGVGGKNG